jgi:hypothetical protein
MEMSENVCPACGQWNPQSAADLIPGDQEQALTMAAFHGARTTGLTDQELAVFLAWVRRCRLGQIALSLALAGDIVPSNVPGADRATNWTPRWVASGAGTDGLGAYGAEAHGPRANGVVYPRRAARREEDDAAAEFAC